MINKNNIIKPKDYYSTEELESMKYEFHNFNNINQVSKELIINIYKAIDNFKDPNVYSSVVEESFYNVFCTDDYSIVERLIFIRYLTQNKIIVKYATYPCFENIVKIYRPILLKIR